MPLTDSTDVEHAQSGSHWSLLLVSVIDHVSFHFDSLPSGDKRGGVQATQKLSVLLDKHLRFISVKDSPEQEKRSDCGVFVCMFMRHLLLRRLLQARADEKISMSLGGKRVDAREGRKEMVTLIEEARRERRADRKLEKYPHIGEHAKRRID